MSLEVSSTNIINFNEIQLENTEKPFFSDSSIELFGKIVQNETAPRALTNLKSKISNSQALELTVDQKVKKLTAEKNHFISTIRGEGIVHVGTSALAVSAVLAALTLILGFGAVFFTGVVFGTVSLWVAAAFAAPLVPLALIAGLGALVAASGAVVLKIAEKKAKTPEKALENQQKQSATSLQQEGEKALNYMKRKLHKLRVALQEAKERGDLHKEEIETALQELDQFEAFFTQVRRKNPNLVQMIAANGTCPELTAKTLEVFAKYAPPGNPPPASLSTLKERVANLKETEYRIKEWNQANYYGTLPARIRNIMECKMCWNPKYKSLESAIRGSNCTDRMEEGFRDFYYRDPDAAEKAAAVNLVYEDLSLWEGAGIGSGAVSRVRKNYDEKISQVEQEAALEAGLLACRQYFQKHYRELRQNMINAGDLARQHRIPGQKAKNLEDGQVAEVHQDVADLSTAVLALDALYRFVFPEQEGEAFNLLK